MRHSLHSLVIITTSDGKLTIFFGPARPVVPFSGPAPPVIQFLILGPFGPVLGPFGARLGPVLGPFGARLGPVWGPAKSC